MTTECTQEPFPFHPLNQREERGQFDGGSITSDAGGLLLREVEKANEHHRPVRSCFTDYRDGVGGHRTGKAQCHTVRSELFDQGPDSHHGTQNLGVAVDRLSLPGTISPGVPAVASCSSALLRGLYFLWSHGNTGRSVRSHRVSRLSHFSTCTGRHSSSARSRSAGDSRAITNARFSGFRNRSSTAWSNIASSGE